MKGPHNWNCSDRNAEREVTIIFQVNIFPAGKKFQIYQGKHHLRIRWNWNGHLLCILLWISIVSDTVHTPPWKITLGSIQISNSLSPRPSTRTFRDNWWRRDCRKLKWGKHMGCMVFGSIVHLRSWSGWVFRQNIFPWWTITIWQAVRTRLLFSFTPMN